MKDKFKMQQKYGYAVFNGVWYELDMDSHCEITYTKVDQKKIKAKMKRAKEMAKKLKDNLDAEKVLTETLMKNFDDKPFDKLYVQLFKSKRKYKAKTRKHHCVDMVVGNTIIPIVD